MSTIFEKIIAREVPASIIYEDDLVISFLDINPVNKGHALIVPKEKFVNLFDADETTIGRMAGVAKIIANAVVKVTGATGATLVMNNGEDAGQDVFHAHFHVIPRHKDDNAFGKAKHVSYEEDESQKLAEEIVKEIN